MSSYEKITLPKILDCLENETNELMMDYDIIEKQENQLKEWQK